MNVLSECYVLNPHAESPGAYTTQARPRRFIHLQVIQVTKEKNYRKRDPGCNSPI
jgi:hypothetical protein